MANQTRIKRSLSTRKAITLGLCTLMVSSLFTGCGSTKNGKSGTKQPASIKVEQVYKAPTAVEDSDVFVTPVDGISDEFIRGMDVSSALAEEKSGVKYYNFDGKEQDIFKTLAEAGTNYIRLRVWNDPKDEKGNGYGGGNNDVDTAIELGKRATKYGMSVYIDFHYSDFWADPNKQMVPKAWKEMKLEEKREALSAYTKESLEKILDAGVNVGMVQIGNEINYGMAGEERVERVNKLLVSAGKAVRDVAKAYKKDIQIAVHYTNLSNDGEIDGLVKGLEQAKVDYDIVALSYYTFWHGDYDNFKEICRMVQDTYHKKVMVAETSYCYTAEDGDGSSNSIGGVDDIVDGYPASVPGQASNLRDVCAAANEAGALGVFYWEPAWIPVGPKTADNSSIWEKYGSGWASSYAKDYDPKDAGQYYGGSSWDNQALFDFEGHPLASLNVYKYLKYGANAPLEVLDIPQVEVTCGVGETLDLPKTVAVKYNDSSKNGEFPVTWNEDVASAIDTNKAGTYEVTGTLEDGTKVSASVEVQMVNYVVNPSFEDSDTSMWKITSDGSVPTDYQEKPDDAHSGDMSLHWWSESDMNYEVTQEIADLAAGTYQLEAFFQGGDVTADADMELFISVNGEETTEKFMVTSWCDWQNPQVKNVTVPAGAKVVVGARMKCNPKSWGTMDDFTLNRISE